jgi:hypothetical protein
MREQPRGRRMDRGWPARRRGRDPNRPLNSLAEGWRARAREKRDNREGGRRSSARTRIRAPARGQAHTCRRAVRMAPPKAFLEVAPLRRGRPDEWKRRYYCVYTRDTRVPLSPHLAWKHSIHKAFRAFLSPPHVHTRAPCSRRRVRDPLPSTGRGG